MMGSVLRLSCPAKSLATANTGDVKRRVTTVYAQMPSYLVATLDGTRNAQNVVNSTHRYEVDHT